MLLNRHMLIEPGSGSIGMLMDHSIGIVLQPKAFEHLRLVRQDVSIKWFSHYVCFL